MSLPEIVAGKDVVIDHKIKAPVVLLSFQTDVGPFYVEMCFKE
jgi:hypothetical protein